MRRGRRSLSFSGSCRSPRHAALPGPARAASPPPTLSAWLKIVPGDARIGRLASIAAAPLSPNAPGSPPEARPAGSGSPETPPRGTRFARSPKEAHRRAGGGASRSSCRTSTIPADVRAAEAATVEDLWPGLGGIFGDAKEADLVTIGFRPRRSGIHEFGRPRKACSIRRQGRICLERRLRGRAQQRPTLVSSSRPVPVATWRTRSARRKATPFRRKCGLCRFRRRDPFALDPRPAKSGSRSTTCRSASPRSSTSISPASAPLRTLLAAAARLAPENVPFVVASPAWAPSKDAALERFARLLDGDFGPDSRAATASAAGGEALDVFRFVARTDLGGVVLIPGDARRRRASHPAPSR